MSLRELQKYNTSTLYVGFKQMVKTVLCTKYNGLSVGLLPNTQIANMRLPNMQITLVICLTRLLACVYLW